MAIASTAASRPADSVVKPLHLSHGTLMCRNLANSRRFYEEFLGLEVVRHVRPAMMLRLRTDFYAVCVCVGDGVPNQHLLTHWGLNVASPEEVDRVHAEAHRLKEVYGIRKINRVLQHHGAYGFYFQDLDCNWWEIQYEPRTADHFFERGDVEDMSTVAVETEESHQ